MNTAKSAVPGIALLHTLISYLFKPLVALLGKICAEALEHLNEQDQNNDRDDHDEVLIAIVAVVDGDLAEAAAADDAAHCRVAENGGQRDGDVLYKRGHALGDHDLADYLEGRRAHALRGLDDVAVKLAQAALDKACDEGKRRRDERNDGRRCADGRAYERPGERKNHDHENKEGDRAQKVYYNVQQVHEPRRQRPDAVLFAGDEQHAERKPDDDRKCGAQDRYIKRLPQGGRERGQEIEKPLN